MWKRKSSVEQTADVHDRTSAAPSEIGLAHCTRCEGRGRSELSMRGMSEFSEGALDSAAVLRTLKSLKGIIYGCFRLLN